MTWDVLGWFAFTLSLVAAVLKGDIPAAVAVVIWMGVILLWRPGHD